MKKKQTQTTKKSVLNKTMDQYSSIREIPLNNMKLTNSSKCLKQQLSNPNLKHLMQNVCWSNPKQSYFPNNVFCVSKKRDTNVSLSRSPVKKPLINIQLKSISPKKLKMSLIKKQSISSTYLNKLNIHSQFLLKKKIECDISKMKTLSQIITNIQLKQAFILLNSKKKKILVKYKEKWSKKDKEELLLQLKSTYCYSSKNKSTISKGIHVFPRPRISQPNKNSIKVYHLFDVHEINNSNDETDDNKYIKNFEIKTIKKHYYHPNLKLIHKKPCYVFRSMYTKTIYANKSSYSIIRYSIMRIQHKYRQYSCKIVRKRSKCPLISTGKITQINEWRIKLFVVHITLYKRKRNIKGIFHKLKSLLKNNSNCILSNNHSAISHGHSHLSSLMDFESEFDDDNYFNNNTDCNNHPRQKYIIKQIPQILKSITFNTKMGK